MSELAFTVILIIPILALLVAAIRYVIGIRTYGLYPPVALAVSLWLVQMDKLANLAENSACWQFDLVSFGVGLFFILISLWGATIARLSVRKLGMHYYGRIALIYTGAALGSVFGLFLTSNFRLVEFTDVLANVLIIASMDRLVTLQFKKNVSAAIRLTVETLLVSVITYLLLSWRYLHDMLYKHPFVVLLVFPGALLIGRWSLLNLKDYFRFKDIVDVEGYNEDLGSNEEE